jgi:hypothetical protein
MEHAKSRTRRCAIYTRKSSEGGLSRTSTRCTRSAKRVRRSPRARQVKAGD